jgi:protein involved in polysaccharide export with SLBB domain
MMDVNIWGFVRSPGKYTVPISTRLVDLISLAGGPAERAELEEVKVVHDLNIDSTIVQTVSMFSVEEYQNTGSPESNPVLYPNDTVIIPGDSLNSFNEILSIVSNIAVVTLSIIGLIFAFKKN